MAKDHGPQIKDDALYEKLRGEGASEEKAARISNAKAAGTLRHDSVPLEERTAKQLQAEAKRIGIAGRSGMKKEALVNAIRGHR